MLILRATADLLRVVTDAAGAVACHVSAMEADNATPPVIQDIVRTNTASITTAATTTILDCTTANRRRNVKHINIRNTHASQAQNLTVLHTDGTNSEDLYKCNLLAGETLILNEAGTWLHYDADGALKPANAKINLLLRVASDVVNATTSFADVTGLTCTLQSGKKYAFEAILFHQTNATTTGAQFGVNIGAAPTVLNLWGQQQITASVTAATFGSSAMVTAVDTAAVVETTGPGAINMGAYLAGFIQPSADGTFAIRCKSEVAVASGLTVKAGSWLRIRECDN